MKIGTMEGTPEEIRDFCQNNGLNIENYLEKVEKPINRYMFICSLCLYVAFIILLTTVSSLSSGWRTVMFLLGCCCSLWLAVAIQIRFKNVCASSLIFLGGIAFMLVALGVISPLELFEKAQDLKPK
jgi:hypothetical protein